MLGDFFMETNCCRKVGLELSIRPRRRLAMVLYQKNNSFWVRSQGEAIVSENELSSSKHWSMLETDEDDASSRSSGPQSRLRLLANARAEVKRRTDRRALFGVYDVLSDPAWDILLELYISGLTGNGLYASVVGAEVGIPQSTTLRWLNVLEKMGLVRRNIDPFDKRRQWVGLTPRACTLMERQFARSL